MVLCLEHPYIWRIRLQQAALSLVERIRQAAVIYREKHSTGESDSTVRGRSVDTEAKEEVKVQAEHLLDAYGNCILRLAYSYLHNMSDAEDILQDTLIQYIKTAPQLTGAAHEKAWLMKVAANLSKNKIRYNQVRRADELDETLAAKERKDLQFV